MSSLLYNEWHCTHHSPTLHSSTRAAIVVEGQGTGVVNIATQCYGSGGLYSCFQICHVEERGIEKGQVPREIVSSLDVGLY